MKSITGAAKAFNPGQTAVCSQRKLLQAEAGDPVYECRGHRIVVTPVGETPVAYAERPAEKLFAVDEFVRRRQPVGAGTLQAGPTNTIASCFLPQYLIHLQTLHS